jgi:hypothetical protein
MPSTPYDTGKVKIGLAYQKPYYCETDERLQVLLLKEEVVYEQNLAVMAFAMFAIFAVGIAVIVLLA